MDTARRDRLDDQIKKARAEYTAALDLVNAQAATHASRSAASGTKNLAVELAKEAGVAWKKLVDERRGLDG